MAAGGLPVVAPVDGIVRATCFWDGSTSGEGNHLWVELDAAAQSWTGATTWLHGDHLRSIQVDVGQRVRAGEALGTCGRTGNWSCAHLHLELCKLAPATWWQWPYGWSKAQVQGLYYDPVDWYRRTVALAGEQAGIPEEATVAIVNGAQQAAVQAVVWGQVWDPAAADFAIPASWREEWR